MLRTAASCFLAVTIAVPSAQTGSPKGTQLKDTQLNPDRVAASTRTIVIGCVSREGAGRLAAFAITDTRAQPAVRYRLDGDPELLRFHTGHLVEVAGPLAADTLKVEALTYLSTACLSLR